MKSDPRIVVRVYRPEAGFVTIALADGKFPAVGSEMQIAGISWLVTMVEYPLGKDAKPADFSGPDGLTRDADGSNVSGIRDREDSP